AAGYLLSLPLSASTWGIMISLMIMNSGVGLAYGAMPALIMGSVPLSETAAANGFNTLMRSLGTSIGAAVIGAVLAQMTINFGGHTMASETGFHTALIIGAAVSLIALLIAAAIPRNTEPTPNEPRRVDESAAEPTDVMTA
ncbi:MFS transporter, partial [Gordonia aichiensis]